MLMMQEYVKTTLDTEIQDVTRAYNTLATELEGVMGKGRMSESQLLAIKDDPKGKPDAKQLSIRLGVLAGSLEKKRAIVERKTALIQTIKLFIQEDKGVLRQGFTTAYYQSLAAKRGGLTETERRDKAVFFDYSLVTAVGLPIGGGGGGGGGGAGGGGGSTVSYAASSSSSSNSKKRPAPPAPEEEAEDEEEVIRVKADGKPDARFKKHARR